MKVVSGQVVVALNSDAMAKKATPPEWIKITPRGRVETRDGRSYAFNPEGLATRFNADNIKIPLDLDHSITHRAAKGDRADAIGWIDTVEPRKDGIYGRVDWLEAGKAALSARTHLYISPTFVPDTDGNATYLHSVALVTAPALSNMPALASAEAGGADVLVALGLPADADHATMLATIAALKADKGQMTAANVALESLAAELNQERRTALALRLEQKVEKAIAGGFITPAMREWAMLSCASDESAFDVFMAKAGPVFAHLSNQMPSLANANVNELRERQRSEEAHSIAAQLGIDPEKLG